METKMLYLQSGVKRVIHVAASRLKEKGKNPTIIIREQVNGEYCKMLACHDVHMLGEIKLTEQFNNPLPFTYGRASVYLETDALLIIKYNGESPPKWEHASILEEEMDEKKSTT